MRAPFVALAIAGSAGVAAADPAAECLAELDRRGVVYDRVTKQGVAIPVEVRGPLGGVTWRSLYGRPLLLDCSLAVSLDDAGPYLVALGITEAGFSSSYSRRNIRGTRRPSKHSYALAIDVRQFAGPELGTLEVALDYEQGLGDAVHCAGQPLTTGGAVLRTLTCQLAHSGLFRTVLTPDYDDAHHDHFHLQARAWSERADLRDPSPAIY
jgi:hypothetical protein